MTTPRKEGSKKSYVQIRRAAEQGEYGLLPMDYQILAHLEDEGTMFGGAYPLGHTSNQLAKELFDGKLKVGVIFPRLSRLEAQGLAISISDVPGTGGRSIWQRTAIGKQKATEEYGLSTNKDGSDV